MKPTNHYDLIVAWWWPSWITTALTFKKNNPNARILVFDKDKFPRYKVWEAILPWSFEILKKLDLMDSIKNAGFIRKVWAYYYWWDRKDIGFYIPWSKLMQDENGNYVNLMPELYSYQVDRYIYDNILVEAAKSRWISFIDWVQSVVTNFLDDDTISSLEINNEMVTWDFYVDATWIYAWIIPANIKKIVNYNFTWDICYHGYLQWATAIHNYEWQENWSATTVWSYWNQCWFWFIPIWQDLVSVWMVFKSSCNPDFIKEKNKEDLLLKILNSKKEVSDAIVSSKFINFRWLDKIIIDKNWNWTASKLFGKNWILVWDSAMFTDPILSSWVTVWHRTWHYVWMLLNQFFRTENLKFRSLLLNTYAEYCNDCYLQFRDVIKFWYDWMDQSYEIDKFFSVGRDTIKKFWIIDQNKHNASFFYLVNWLLQTVNWISDDISVNFDQDDYEIMIQWITWVETFLDSSDILDANVFKFITEYTIKKRLRFNGDSFLLQEYITINNKFESAFFISGNLASFIQKIDWIKSIGDIFTNIGELQGNMVPLNNLKKDIKKMILLDLLIKVS